MKRTAPLRGKQELRATVPLSAGDQPLRRHKPLKATVPLAAGDRPLRRHKTLRTASAPASLTRGKKTTPKTTSTRRAGKTSGDTSFPPAVRAAIRKRAQNCCEACGIYLGPEGGQIQHRLARKAGGRRGAMRLLLRSAVNGALLCGTPGVLCHGLCESRDTHMLEAGFWLKEGQHPAGVPILWHGRSGGTRLFLTGSGGYSEYSPGSRGEAA
jgi:hypothetical protein